MPGPSFGIRSAHRVDNVRFRRTTDAVTDETTTRTFKDLMLPSQLTLGLTNAGFIHPSPIQWAALPQATKVGLDLIVQSKSGTGKTLVYVVTALNMINTETNAIQALVIAPTREIAVQASRVALDIAGASYPDLKVNTFIGGIPIEEDQVKLKRCHLAIGTPGRLKQLLEEDHLLPQYIRFLALDEADRLMDQSFKNEITWIFNRLPKAKQVMALSATYPDELAEMLLTYMKDPRHVRLNQECQVLKGVSQYVMIVPFHPQPREQDKIKFEALLNILTSVTFSQCLVFTNYVTKAQSVCEKLNQHGWPAIYIASSQDQKTRLRVLNSLKLFQCRVLLTTDLTARGIDAQNVNLVINLDVPWESETFLHRIGRAGRFGSYGVALSLPSEGPELDLLRNIVFYTGSQMALVPYEPGSKESIPDLWKIQQVKNGLAIAKDEIPNANLNNFLEPLEPQEQPEAEPETEPEPEPGKKVNGKQAPPSPEKTELPKSQKKQKKKSSKSGKFENADLLIKEEEKKIQGIPPPLAKIYFQSDFYNDMNPDELNYEQDFCESAGGDNGGVFNQASVDENYFDENYYDCNSVGEEVDERDSNYFDANYFEGNLKNEECAADEQLNESEEVDDIDQSVEDDVISPRFFIDYYEKVTGYRYTPTPTTEEEKINPEPAKNTELSFEDAQAMLKGYLEEKVKKSQSSFNQRPTLAMLEAKAEQFLLESSNVKTDPEEIVFKQDPDYETLLNASNVTRKKLEQDWNQKVVHAQARLALSGDLAASVQMLMNDEELPELPCASAKSVPNEIAITQAGDHLPGGIDRLHLVDIDPSVLKIEPVDSGCDIQSNEKVANRVETVQVSSVSKPTKTLKVKDFANEMLANNGYPEPYKAEWVPVEAVPTDEPSCEVIWQKGDELAEDEESEENNQEISNPDETVSKYPEPFCSSWIPVETPNPQNVDFFWQAGDEISEDDEPGGGVKVDGGYPFPYPDPDEVMSKFLGNSWRSAFPQWLDHVQRNKRFIEETEYQRRISSAPASATASSASGNKN